jgi:hypothetical protein
MSKITKGCLAMIVDAGRNSGVIVTVNYFVGHISYAGFGEADYWDVTPPRPILSVLGDLVTEGVCREVYLKRISPPDDEHVPDPVEVDLPIKETV